MIRKMYSKAGTACRVTFELPAEVHAENARICGEFNDWRTDRAPMNRRKDGSFTLTLSLKPERTYRFRYLLDGNRWTNEPTADGSVPNGFDSEDSLLRL